MEVIMVTRFKVNGKERNEPYVDYIKEQVNTNFPLWKEEYCVYNSKCNCNFGVGYKYNDIEIDFVQDRGSIEIQVTKNRNEPKNFSWENDIRQGIINAIPDVDPEWCCRRCKEVIDFYINFLKERIDTFVWDE